MGDVTLTIDDVKAEVRAWLDANWDPEITVAEWWKRLAAAGYASPMLPPELGGRPRAPSGAVSARRWASV